MVAPAMAPTAPIHENKELVSCDIVCDSSSSITTMSEENLFSIRPMGVTSKKATGAPNVAFSRNLCNFDDVPVKIVENEVDLIKKYILDV